MINLVLIYCGIRTGHFGMGSFTKLLIDNFSREQNYNVTVLKFDSKDVKHTTYSRVDGVEMIEIPQPENGIYLMEFDDIIQDTYARRLFEIAHPYLVSKSNLLLLCNTVVHYRIARELKLGLNANLVYVHHNFTWKSCIKTSYEHFGKEWIKGNRELCPEAFIGTEYQQRIAHLSNAVVTVTDQAKQFFIEFLGISKDRIRRIYNGIPSNTEDLRGKKLALRDKYGFSRENKIILFCGRLADEKGLSYLIEAFKHIASVEPHSHLLIIGAGTFESVLEQLNPLWRRVTLTGKLTYSQISEMYAIADIGVMPSTQEQCSISSIEMRYHKLPLVVSAVEGLDEMFIEDFDAAKIPAYLDDNQIIFFKPEELATQILRLLSDSTLTDELVRNSYIRGVELFSSERMIHEFDTLFTDLSPE